MFKSKKVDEIKQKTESSVIVDIDGSYPRQSIFIAPKVRIIEWVHPETRVQYIIVESKYPGTSTAIAITPSLNSDGTVRVKK